MGNPLFLPIIARVIEAFVPVRQNLFGFTVEEIRALCLFHRYCFLHVLQFSIIAVCIQELNKENALSIPKYCQEQLLSRLLEYLSPPPFSPDFAASTPCVTVICHSMRREHIIWGLRRLIVYLFQ
jgi:hypothetical protein